MDASLLEQLMSSPAKHAACERFLGADGRVELRSASTIALSQ